VQQALWDAFPNPGQVARPGRSNHQNGIAIDIDTGGFQTPLYLWMKAHAPDYGFIRTVSGEHWHWEHRPADAAAHGYRLPTVNP
jgi:LAS superfamily LD-carboxypeptidase LdcB